MTTRRPKLAIFAGDPLATALAWLAALSAVGLKVSDKFTDIFYRTDYRQLHQVRNSVAWQNQSNMNGHEIAEGHWKQIQSQITHANISRPRLK